jgi:hypothetical protein
MENIAPEIIRQRLLIEGFYTREMDEAKIKSFLTELADHIKSSTLWRTGCPCARRGR